MIYSLLEKKICSYIVSKNINSEGLEKIPKKGPVIITSNHPKWWDPAVLHALIQEKTGRKPKFLTSRSVSNFSNCYNSSVRYLKRNPNRLVRLFSSIISIIPAAIIPPLIKNSGSVLFVSKKNEGGCSKEAINEAEEYLKTGGLLVIYSQGTTVNEDQGVGALKAGTAYVAYKLLEKENKTIPVYPMYITGTNGNSLFSIGKEIKLKIGEQLKLGSYVLSQNWRYESKRFTEIIRQNMDVLAESLQASGKSLEQKI